jgi:hypothetical protein
VRATLCKLEGGKLRISIAARRFVYFNLSKRYFRLPEEFSSSGIGEPVITPDRLPVHCPDRRAKPVTEKMAWDSNMLSLDGYSPETGEDRYESPRYCPHIVL